MNLGRILAVAICIAVIVIALIFALSVRAQYQLESVIHETVPCGDEAMERKIQSIMQESLENALKAHIERTFDVMMRNFAGGGDEDSIRQNAIRGVRGGVNAYIQANRSVATWSLRRC